MLDASAGKEGTPSVMLIDALNECFDAFSSDKQVLTSAEEEQWLLAINKKLGRGSEFRAAIAAKEAHGNTPLTRTDFISIYQDELAQGKFWGVEHDVRVMRGAGLSDGKAFTANFDYIYHTTSTLRLMCVTACNNLCWKTGWMLCWKAEPSYRMSGILPITCHKQLCSSFLMCAQAIK